MTSLASDTSQTVSKVLAPLTDRFTRRDGRILITGVQALVRLMLLQAERDKSAGLTTGGFVSGYRGSPLASLDNAFAGAGKFIKEYDIHVQPAVNEELGATAVAGSQQIDQTSEARVDGIFSLWYGKGPGLDRASDALRHGNTQGSSPHGGVVLAVGDDHVAKSSSIVCYSDEVVAGIQVPLFYPADPGEVVTYGLHGFAMSRLTGSYAALKIITEVADSTRAVETSELDVQPVLPDIEIPSNGLHNRWPEMPLEQEARLVDYRLPAVAAYVRANRLDRIVLKKPGAKVGLVSAGKPWFDLLEALSLLGLDETNLAELGIALYKPALIWPLEPLSLAEFAEGLETLVVVEEKVEFLERQVKSHLYGKPDAPNVWGKSGPEGSKLFPATGDLKPELIAASLGPLLSKILDHEALAKSADSASGLLETQGRFAVAPVLRKPFFCSGCPHNRSTVVPEGSRALAGIGCHGLAAYNRPFTGSFSQMGGEGVHWMGLAPFTDEKHVFANMGDGTYFHSGLLAIRQAVSAKLNITYKVLYNSAVAMTGGQSIDGEMTVEQLVDQLRAESVDSVLVVSDDPDRYGIGHPVRRKAEQIVHRDDLEALQQELRDRSGVSVIVYEQMCATEKRRMRKRGKMEDPAKRVFINELVCEGCGDCSAKSNCLSVEPVETPFGTKRRINQSSCNKDFSCTTGFCPSFVTVEGGAPARAAPVLAKDLISSSLPVPPTPKNDHERIVVAGVGGTGIVTIGALVAVAAHAQGAEVAVLDQVGMAQKGGAVVSHVHVSKKPVAALRIAAEMASLVIACDEVVGNSRDVIASIAPGKTPVLANTDISVTGDFTQNRNAVPDGALLAARMKKRSGKDMFFAYPFTQISTNLLGNSIGANLMMVGFAWQKGWLNLDQETFDAAIELNGAAVEMNRNAFALGRQIAVEPEPVLKAAGILNESPANEDKIAKMEEFLVGYQDRAYADRFMGRVRRVAEAEAEVGGDGSLAETVARGLFRVMAYKDEYEVARLYTDGRFTESIGKAFDGKVRLKLHMAPPLISRRDKATGHLRKREFGAWILPFLRLLARGKTLRGTRFDLFGYTGERKAERQLITDYEALIDRVLTRLDPDNIDEVKSIAALILDVRGYGHVKEEAAAAYELKLAKALERFESKSTTLVAAE